MKKEIIISLSKTFEESAYEQDGVEYWLARDLQVLLGCSEWRNFALVIDKAKISCKNARQNVADHFVDINKMVGLGSGAQREIDDVMLTRSALVGWAKRVTLPNIFARASWMLTT